MLGSLGKGFEKLVATTFFYKQTLFSDSYSTCTKAVWGRWGVLALPESHGLTLSKQDYTSIGTFDCTLSLGFHNCFPQR